MFQGGGGAAVINSLDDIYSTWEADCKVMVRGNRRICDLKWLSYAYHMKSTKYVEFEGQHNMRTIDEFSIPLLKHWYHPRRSILRFSQQALFDTLQAIHWYVMCELFDPCLFERGTREWINKIQMMVDIVRFRSFILCTERLSNYVLEMDDQGYVISSIQQEAMIQRGNTFLKQQPKPKIDGEATTTTTTTEQDKEKGGEQEEDSSSEYQKKLESCLPYISDDKLRNELEEKFKVKREREKKKAFLASFDKMMTEQKNQAAKLNLMRLEKNEKQQQGGEGEDEVKPVDETFGNCVSLAFIHDINTLFREIDITLRRFQQHHMTIPPGPFHTECEISLGMLRNFLDNRLRLIHGTIPLRRQWQFDLQCTEALRIVYMRKSVKSRADIFPEAVLQGLHPALVEQNIPETTEEFSTPPIGISKDRWIAMNTDAYFKVVSKTLPQGDIYEVLVRDEEYAMKNQGITEMPYMFFIRVCSTWCLHLHTLGERFMFPSFSHAFIALRFYFQDEQLPTRIRYYAASSSSTTNNNNSEEDRKGSLDLLYPHLSFKKVALFLELSQLDQFILPPSS